jgi:hypothetical protein
VGAYDFQPIAAQPNKEQSGQTQTEHQRQRHEDRPVAPAEVGYDSTSSSANGKDQGLVSIVNPKQLSIACESVDNHGDG